MLAGGVELDTKIFVVTEEVRPLSEALGELKAFPHAISWGLYQVAVRAMLARVNKIASWQETQRC